LVRGMIVRHLHTLPDRRAEALPSGSDELVYIIKHASI